MVGPHTTKQTVPSGSDKSRWFSVELTERDALWAFIKGVPPNTISTLELLATTLGLFFLAPAELQAPGVAYCATVTGFCQEFNALPALAQVQGIAQEENSTC